jgi:transcriptional regulator of aromatic amino acid metabolism
MNPVRASLRYPQVIIAPTITLVACGVYALLRMPRREDPKIHVREGIVAAYYPGASAAEVEDEVARKVEQHVWTEEDVHFLVQGGQNRFRSDLYYRLHVFPLNVPSLRERREDIPLLTRIFVQKHAQRMDRKIERIPTQALDALTNYEWPGNIRELQNVIERSVILSNGHELQVAVPEIIARPNGAPLYGRVSHNSEAAERARILHALKEAKGLVGGPNGAAARLGLKRTTLQSRMRKYNIGGRISEQSGNKIVSQ